MNVCKVPYQAFPTADGYIIVGAGNNKQFERLCKAIGQPEVRACFFSRYSHAGRIGCNQSALRVQLLARRKQGRASSATRGRV